MEGLKKHIELARANPIADSVVRKLVERKELGDGEAKFYQQHKKFLDEWIDGDGKATGIRRLLQEARNSGLLKGDLGENYYPRQSRTFGDLISDYTSSGKDLNVWLKENAPRILDDVAGNLDLSRETSAITEKNYGRLIESYTNQLYTKKWRGAEAKEIGKAFEERMSSNRPNEANTLASWLRNNVLNRLNETDKAAHIKRLESIFSEQLKVGDTFKSSGAVTDSPVGKVKIDGDWIGEKQYGSHKGEPLYKVSIDGKSYPRPVSRLDLLSWKYADTVIDQRPITKIVNTAGDITAGLTIAFNPRSFFTAAISNFWKSVSSDMAMADKIVAGSKTIQHFLNKGNPEIARSIKNMTDWGLLDSGTMKAATGDISAIGGESWARKLAYANVNLPDLIHKIWAYEGFNRKFLREHPEWSETRRLAEVKLHVSQIADVIDKGTTAPLGFEPAYRALSFLSNSGRREVAGYIRKVLDGRYMSAGVQLGGTAATIGALVKLANINSGKDISDEDLVKKVGNKLVDMFPYISANGIPLPALLVPVDKSKKLINYFLGNGELYPALPAGLIGQYGYDLAKGHIESTVPGGPRLPRAKR